MPLTTPDLVRTHLAGLRTGESHFSGEPVTLSGTLPAQLAFTGLVPDSLVLKSQHAGPPNRETRVLPADWTNLNHTHLVPGSVLVAADSSVTVVYAENEDYVVNSQAGQIRRLTSGAIPADMAVTIWYARFRLYTEGDDFTVEAADGIIRRVATGQIADGQTVLADYTVSPGNIQESAITHAIAEAAESVLAFIDAKFHDLHSPALVIGETHWAVAALCRMRAAAALAESQPGHTALAQSWITLAAQYDQSGQRYLAPHAQRTPPRQSPRIA